MGTTERRQRQKDELRNAILRAAWRIVKDEGWPALSIRRIADAVEYSVPVIYSHFENKDAILHEFSKEGFRLLHDALQSAKRKAADPDTELRAIANGYRAFAFTHREYYQLMFGLGIPTCEVVKSVEELKSVTDLMIGTITAVIRNGRNPDSDVFLKFHTFWSILHGMISIQMVSGNEEPDKMKRAILNDAIDGFIKALTL